MPVLARHDHATHGLVTCLLLHLHTVLYVCRSLLSSHLGGLAVPLRHQPLALGAAALPPHVHASALAEHSQLQRGGRKPPRVAGGLGAVPGAAREAAGGRRGDQEPPPAKLLGEGAGPAGAL